MSNPLLNNFETPHQTVPFDAVKPLHFEPAIKQKIKVAKHLFKEITNNNSEASFENTIIPIEKLVDDVSRIGQILFNLNSAETNKSIQEVTIKVSSLFTKFISELLLDKKYFNRVKRIYQNRHKENLSTEEIRLVETTYVNMKRNGANLPIAKKNQLTRLLLQLSNYNLKFNNNVLDETNEFELHIINKNDLVGLPENEIENGFKTAKQKGKSGWIFTLQYPSYIPFMKYADNRSLREKMYRAFTSKANRGNEKDNNKHIHKIINLRLKQAQLLDYNNYADYALEERMAKKADKVIKFINELHIASKPHAVSEIDELIAFAKTIGFKHELMPWDFSYLSEKHKAYKFGFEENSVKPYFQLQKVIYGIFQLATDLYGLTFKKAKRIQVYHNDVEAYKVFDETEKFLAVLYTDFHPRENKQSGAWMTEFRSQSNINGNLIRPHISICCNFTKPTYNKPSLLTFSEVNTFLHEFGHALHGMLAKTVYPSISGTNVLRDFVELPSQIMENWLTEFEWLEKFAVHYKTGEKIPKILITKLIDSRNFQAGYQSERQLSFATLDMAWHTINKPFKSDNKMFEENSLSNIQLLPSIKESCISTSFSHIFAGGYAAGYYGYKWAEVLDADAFSVFKKNGIFNKAIAKKFRNEILEKGGTEHPTKLYKNFRGKEASIKALIERSGLN